MFFVFFFIILLEKNKSNAAPQFVTIFRQNMKNIL